MRFAVDLWRGQKTGLFLDQRENHLVARAYARGRVLDGFTYDGGFALQWRGSRDEVLAVDVSAEAVARVEANAARNGLANVTTRDANVFDLLRELDQRGRALRHRDPRPSRVRQEPGRGREGGAGLQGHQPAGARSSCGPAAA